MFRPTDPQLSRLESRFVISPKKRARLERSWAEPFRQHVLPLIDEELFRDCFCEDNGRPNTSIRVLVGLHLLKEADDLTDEQILDALEFNLQWQHALGVQPADAHVCEKTLHNFRNRMLGSPRACKLYEQLTAALMKADGLSAVRQRLDSTHTLSNIAVLSRLGVFTETVTAFLRDLRRDAPAKLTWLGEGYTERYLAREGFFADAKREDARRRLPMVAHDLHALVYLFAEDAEVREWASYGLLVRLLAEQCDVTGEPGPEGPVTIKPPQEVGGGSLQSPHDPDATYGHKGKGYEVQLAETCVAENPYQVITAVDVTDANGSDQNATMPIVEKLIENGRMPDEILADTGYGSGENIVACAKLGVTLVAPVQDADKPAPVTPGCAAPPREERREIDLGDFAFNAAFDRVESCPAGHAAIEQHTMPSGLAARFGGAACAGCPYAASCPAQHRAHTEDRVLRWRPPAAATATRQRVQQTRAFKQNYKLRSGIESTNAEFKGRHGGRKLRVRGRQRVELAVYLKATALNVKRAVQHHTARLRMASEPETAMEMAG